MTTTTFTPQQKLTLIKHLAGGKAADVVAAIMHTTKDQVIDLARNHGYPDTEKLKWAADIMAKKLETDDQLPERPSAAGEPMRPRGESVTSPPAGAPAQGAPLTRPDEIRILLNTAKGHPSKRIQGAANRVFDQLDNLRALIAEDEKKNAEKRRIAVEKAAAREEVERLKRELAQAQAKLRGKPASESTAQPSRPAASSAEPSAKEIRSWARSAGVDCPDVGRVPASVREAYDDAHSEAVAS